MYTVSYLVFPGVLAFCMVLSEFYILQRAGMLPMSIAGIAKEVSTISVSAWLFGDELTPLNITGVAITICGIILFTYHRYRKSIESTLPVDMHGNPIEEELDLTLGPVGSPRQSGGALHRRTDSITNGYDYSEGVGESTDGDRLLFSVGSDDEQDAEELRSIRSSKVLRSPSENGKVSDPRREVTAGGSIDPWAGAGKMGDVDSRKDPPFGE